MCALRVSFIVRFFLTSSNVPPKQINSLPLHAPTPLPTCFWLKAWAEPPSPQIEAPLRRRAWSVSSSQGAKGEQGRGIPTNEGRPLIARQPLVQSGGEWEGKKSLGPGKKSRVVVRTRVRKSLWRLAWSWWLFVCGRCDFSSTVLHGDLSWWWRPSS